MPVTLNPAQLTGAQWSFLVAVLQGEAGLGSGPPGTTPGNRLDGIRYVGKAFALWTEIVPSIGVQLVHVNKKNYASARDLVTSTFHIIVATKSTDESATTRNGGDFQKANLEDANAQLQVFLGDDGINGLSPVLDDPQYRLLGSSTVDGLEQNNARYSQVTDIDYQWDSSGGEAETNAQVWAYGVITLMAQQQVATF